MEENEYYTAHLDRNGVCRACPELTTDDTKSFRDFIFTVHTTVSLLMGDYSIVSWTCKAMPFKKHLILV